MPSRPCAPSFGHSSRGNSLLRSMAAARGAISCAAKRRTCRRISSSSGPAGRSRCRCSRAWSWACLRVGHDRMIVGQTGNHGKSRCPASPPVSTRTPRNTATTPAAMLTLTQDSRTRWGARPLGARRPPATSTRPAGSSLLARAQRIRVLLDTGSPFLELSQLAAHGMYGGEIACAGHPHRHRPDGAAVSA